MTELHEETPFARQERIDAFIRDILRDRATRAMFFRRLQDMIAEEKAAISELEGSFAAFAPLAPAAPPAPAAPLTAPPPPTRSPHATRADSNDNDVPSSDRGELLRAIQETGAKGIAGNSLGRRFSNAKEHTQALVEERRIRNLNAGRPGMPKWVAV